MWLAGPPQSDYTRYSFLLYLRSLIGAMFRIIDIGLAYGNQDVFFDHDALNPVAVIVLGIVSIIVIEIALRMGVPLQLPKEASKGGHFTVHKP